MLILAPRFLRAPPKFYVTISLNTFTFSFIGNVTIK